MARLELRLKLPALTELLRASRTLQPYQRRAKADSDAEAFAAGGAKNLGIDGEQRKDRLALVRRHPLSRRSIQLSAPKSYRREAGLCA